VYAGLDLQKQTRVGSALNYLIHRESGIDWRVLRRRLVRQTGTRVWAIAAGAVLAVAAAGMFLKPQWELHMAQSARPVTPYPRELTRVSFAVAGDVIPHDAVRAAAAANGEGAQGWAALFNDVSDVFQGADLGFVNLETPVAPAHSHGSKPFLFDAPVALPEALKASGVKIVSFANNHVMDQGWAGFAETREHLREIGLEFAGSGDTAQQTFQPVILETSGIKVGWLGMTRWLNGNRNPDKDDQPHVNFFPYPGEANGAPGADEARVISAIHAARAQCDFLVISIHWGIEYAPAPRPEDIDLAHRMLDAGASVIVGHHPHVLQAVETYRTADGRNAVIFYSLGNFLSNQSRNYVDRLMPDRDGDPRDSMIALFSAVREDYGPAGVRVELGHVGILPVWGENNRNEIASGKSKAPAIHPVLIDREMPRLQARLDELTKLPQPLTAEQQHQFIEVTSQLKLLDDRRKLLLARTGDDYLTDPPGQPSKP
jgi:poly-gamma-glutamate synthesis protein (capsule biosynthesis protein)